MQETRKVLIQNKKDRFGWILLVIFICVLPLYGLYFTSGTSKNGSMFQAVFDSAVQLELSGFSNQAIDAYWRAYALCDAPDAMKVLEKIAGLEMKLKRYSSALSSLYAIESLVRSGHKTSYDWKNAIANALSVSGKEKDAGIFLKSATQIGQIGTRDQGSGSMVLARMNGDEIVYNDLEKAMNQKTEKEKEQILMGEIFRRLLLRESGQFSSREDFQKKLFEAEKEFRIHYVLEDYNSKLSPTEFELKNFYEANRNLFFHPQGFRILHLFHPQDLSVVSGDFDEKSFREACEKKSKCLSRIYGGEVQGWVESDRMPQIGEIEGLYDFLCSQKGSLSEVFHSQRGYHRFWILERRPEEKIAFSKEHPKILHRYHQEQEKSGMDRLYTELMKKYQVVIDHDALKDVPSRR